MYSGVLHDWRRVDGVKVDAMIQHERAVNLISTQVRVAPTPKEKKKKGQKLSDDAKPSPSKKPRVAGGAARQKSMDKELLRDDAVDVDDENKDIVDGNDWLKQLARQRAERRK